jgi:hypothetical protein
MTRIGASRAHRVEMLRAGQFEARDDRMGRPSGGHRAALWTA